MTWQCEAELLRLVPSVARERSRELGAIWDEQVNRILRQMFDLTADSGRVELPLDGRAEVVGELARLMLFLSSRVVASRLEGREVHSIDLEQERAELETPTALERVRNTAQNVATRIWFKVYDEIRARRTSLDPSKPSPWPPPLPGRAPRRPRRHTLKNHYVPEFSSAPWKNGQQKARLIKRDERGIVTTSVKPHSAWGYEKRLYPQHLEDWFSLIENSAAGPYMKLVTSDILTPEDRYFWSAFIITQFLRTPTYFAAAAKQLRRIAVSEEWPWHMSPDLLKRSHQTLFDQDVVFAEYYRRLQFVRWRILTTEETHPYPRTDTPVVISASTGWTCYYPLTPTKCFVAGPQGTTEWDVPAALSEPIDVPTHAQLSQMFLQNSRRAFLIRADDDFGHWRMLAEKHLPQRDPAADCIAWGELYTL